MTCLVTLEILSPISQGNRGMGVTFSGSFVCSQIRRECVYHPQCQAEAEVT